VATEKERDFLAEVILPSIETNSVKLGKSKITGFLSMKGDLYNSKLMVIGRAVNGWTEGICPSELKSKISKKEYADTVFNTITRSDGCPMEWVTECWGSQQGYNTKKSAFWRVIRSVVGELGLAELEQNNWPSHLVWSNLYKLSPEAGGNPSSSLCKIQFPGCCSLLEIELLNYLPKRLLFLTGIGWARPFLENICSVVKGEQRHVEAKGTFKLNNQTIQVVVATHPQGKPENEWVQEVIKAFQYNS